MPSADKELQLMIRREINRRYLDSTLVDVHAVHGVVYLRGTIRPIRGFDIDVRNELGVLEHVLRQKPGVREVINEMQVRS